MTCARSSSAWLWTPATCLWPTNISKSSRKPCRTTSRPSELRGRLLEYKGQYAEARTCFEEAIKGHLVDSYQHLAFLLRTQPDPAGPAAEQVKKADDVMNQLVTDNPTDFKAWLAHWHYSRKYSDFSKDRKKFQEAKKDVEEAQRLAPDEPEVLMARAEVKDLDGGDPCLVGTTTLGMVTSPWGTGPLLAAEAYLAGKRNGGWAAACRFLMKELERPEHERDTGLYQALVSLLRTNPACREQAIDYLLTALQKLPSHRQYEFLWALTNLYIDQGLNKDENGRTGLDIAEPYLAELHRIASPASIDFLDGRILMVKEKWPEAAYLLERARPGLENLHDMGPQVLLYLVQCYEKLGDTERQRKISGLLVQGQPDALPYRLILARTLADQGQLDQAIEEYRTLVKLPLAPPTAWLEIVRLVIRRNPQDPRVKEALDDAEKALKIENNPALSTELTLLRAETLDAQGNWQKAYDTVAAACRQDRHFQQPRLYLALAILLDQKGEKEKEQARQLFKQIEEELEQPLKADLSEDQRTGEKSGPGRSARGPSSFPGRAAEAIAGRGPPGPGTADARTEHSGGQ